MATPVTLHRRLQEKLLLIVTCLAILAVFWGCPTTGLCQEDAVNHLVPRNGLGLGQAEVSPGRFVVYLQYNCDWDFEDGSFTAVHARTCERQKFYQKNTTYLSIPWQDEELSWVGFGVPISLREWEGRLYLIVFDRETDFARIRFRFYRQNQGSLAEISPDTFPKAIATQNLWLREENGTRNGKPVNEIEIAKNLDPTEVDFQDSLTAKIWFQLETGKEYYHMPQTIDSAFLSKFLKENAVLRLTEIKHPVDADRAIALCTKMIDMHTQDWSIYLLRAKQYYHQGGLDKAISDLTQAIRLKPDDARIYYLRSDLYRKKGDEAQAQKDEAEATRLGLPKPPEP